MRSNGSLRKELKVSYKSSEDKCLKKQRGKNWDFHYNMIKSKTAEAIVQRLFLAEGYNVHNYGMENAIPGILGTISTDKSETARKIRSMPDLVVQTPDKESLYFIEVKYRANGKFNLGLLEKDFEYMYKSAYFIIVSKTSLKCITYSEMQRGFYINENTDNHLSGRKEFHFSDFIYREVLDLVENMYCNID